MTETENGDTTPLKPKKSEGSRLDRGFPMGKVLLIILGLVFFFQIISAWKIINLEREKAIYETDKQNFENQVKQRPGLKREIGELKVERKELKSKINDLKLENTQVTEELTNNQKKSDKLKSAINNAITNLRDLEKQAIEKKVESDAALIKRDKLNMEAGSLYSKIEECQSDINAYQDKKRILKEGLGELEEEKKKLESNKNRLISDNADINARIKARKDELEALKGSNSALAGIIESLKETIYTITSSSKTFVKSQRDSKAKFEHAIKVLNTATSNISSSAQEFKNSQSEANNKFKETVDNINKVSSKLENTTTKINLAAGSLNKNVKQLFTIGSKLDNLSVQLNNSANKVDNELKIIDQRLNTSEIKQKQLEELLANITRISGSLSSDRAVLNNTLNELKEDVGSAVKKLDVVTSNIESNSKDFKEKVSTLDDSNRELNLLLDNIKRIYRELDTIKQRQTELVDNSQDLVNRIKQSFDQIRNDSSSAIDGVKGLKNIIKEVEKKVESLNTGTKKPNEKEEE